MIFSLSFQVFVNNVLPMSTLFSGEKSKLVRVGARIGYNRIGVGVSYSFKISFWFYIDICLQNIARSVVKCNAM